MGQTHAPFQAYGLKGAASYKQRRKLKLEGNFVWESAGWSQATGAAAAK